MTLYFLMTQAKTLQCKLINKIKFSRKFLLKMKAQSFWAKCSFYTATERSDKKDFAINGFFAGSFDRLKTKTKRMMMLEMASSLALTTICLLLVISTAAEAKSKFTREFSVTRLGYFGKAMSTNCPIKVAQKLSKFLGSFQVKLFLANV